MVTDDFTERAYAIIAKAARVSYTLKAELGAMNSRYSNEEDWLRGAEKRLRGIQANP